MALANCLVNSHQSKEHKQPTIDGIGDRSGSRVLGRQITVSADKVTTLTDGAVVTRREEGGVLGKLARDSRGVVVHRVARQNTGVAGDSGVEVGRVGKRGDEVGNVVVVDKKSGLGGCRSTLHLRSLCVGVHDVDAFPELGHVDGIVWVAEECSVESTDVTVCHRADKVSRGNCRAFHNVVLHDLPDLYAA